MDAGSQQHGTPHRNGSSQGNGIAHGGGAAKPPHAPSSPEARAGGLEALTIQKLFEQAMLNALSLLDEDEMEAFETAWRAAPRELQAELIRQEALAVDFRDTLPEGEPPAQLRERVRAAVRAAVGERAATGENGPRARVHGPQSDRRPGSGRAAGRSAALGSVLFRGRRVHHLWRAVAIGLAVAVVGLGALQVHVIRQTTAAGDLAATGELLDRLGPDARELLFGDTVERRRLTATDAAGDAVAVLWRNTDTGVGRLLCSDLEPVGGAYRVVALNASGRIERELATLQASGSIASASVPSLPRGTTLAVLPPAGLGVNPLFRLTT